MTNDEDYLSNTHCFIKNDTLYILGEFNQDISNNVIPELGDLISRFEQTKNPQFEIIINSCGGYTYELFGLLFYLDIMKAMGVRIITKVIGYAESCASMLACYGDERYMSRRAVQMMHLGEYPLPPMKTYEDIKRCSKGSEKHFDNIVQIYKEHSRMSADVIKDKLKNDHLYLTAEQCVKYGLCDYII